MQNDRLTLAGILCIVRATLSLLLASLVSRLATQAGFGPKLITALLTLIAFLLFAFIFSTFKRLLNERYQFHNTDLAIVGLIGLSGLAALITVGSLFLSTGTATDTMLLKLVYVAFGLLLAGFAMQLMRLGDNLFGFLKPYAILTGVAGVGIASIKLAGVGVILGAIADVILAVILVKSSGKR